MRTPMKDGAPDLPEGFSGRATLTADGDYELSAQVDAAALMAELAALKARAAEIESALNIVAPWQPGVEVKTGEVYSHGGANWRIVQDHTTASHWQPGSPGLEALYAKA